MPEQLKLMETSLVEKPSCKIPKLNSGHARTARITALLKRQFFVCFVSSIYIKHKSYAAATSSSTVRI